MSLKTVIFDFDGTLADTGSLLLKAVNKYSKKYGYSSFEDLSCLKNKSLRQLISDDLKLPSYKIPQYAFRMRKFLKQKANEITFFQEMGEIVQRLSEKYEVGIVSSNSKKIITQTLKRLNINSFSFVQCNHALFDKHKTLKKLLKKKKLKKEETIYVGDEIRDVKACQKAKIKMIAVTWGFDSDVLLSLENPDFIATSPSQLLSFFAE